MFGTNSRLYIPALGRFYSALDPYALPLLRIAMGVILFPHGAQKFFGWFGGAGFARFTTIFENIGYKPGALWVTVVASIELIGGILLILGLFTRAVAALLLLFMINAIWVTSAKGFFWTAGGLEYSLLIGIIAVVFLVKGGGNLSLDSKMGKEF